MISKINILKSFSIDYITSGLDLIGFKILFDDVYKPTFKIKLNKQVNTINLNEEEEKIKLDYIDLNNIYENRNKTVDYSYLSKWLQNINVNLYI